MTEQVSLFTNKAELPTHSLRSAHWQAGTDPPKNSDPPTIDFHFSIKDGISSPVSKKDTFPGRLQGKALVCAGDIVQQELYTESGGPPSAGQADSALPENGCNRHSEVTGLSTVPALSAPPTSCSTCLLDLMAAQACYKTWETSFQDEHINKCIAACQRVLRTTTIHASTHVTALHTWGSALCSQGILSGSKQLLDNGITRLRSAASACDSVMQASREHHSIMHTLASALHAQWDTGGELQDLQESIDLRRRVCSQVLPSDADSVPFRRALSTALFSRFAHFPRQIDIDEVICLDADVLSASLEDSSTHLQDLLTLARSLLTKWDYDGDPDDITRAISLLRRAILIPMSVDDRAALLNALSEAIQSRTRLTDRDIDECVQYDTKQSCRFDWTRTRHGVGSHVPASHSVQCPFRTSSKSGCTTRSAAGSITLGKNQAASSMVRAEDSIVQRDPTKIRDVDRTARLNMDWGRLMAEARRITGTEDIMTNCSLNHSMTAFPVVMLNAADARCDALIIRGKSVGVQQVSLSDLDSARLDALVAHMAVLIRESGRGHRHLGKCVSRKRKAVADPLYNVLETLWTLIVEPILTTLGYQPTNAPPRLWWFPTGPFWRLPLHAAGVYAGPEQVSIHDYLVSSYLPALDAKATTTTIDRPPRILAIYQIETAGYPPLHGTVKEVSAIETLASPGTFTALGGQEATVAKVSAALPSANIFHVALHGKQDSSIAVDSCLCLSDRPLKLSELIEMNLPNAEIAFLSACQTATGHTKLPDESIHIAAAMLFTGFKGAIGTMWSIDDQDGPPMAAETYKYILGKEKFSPTDAAMALHLAVLKLRSQGVPPMRWVPFIHLGV